MERMDCGGGEMSPGEMPPSPSSIQYAKQLQRLDLPEAVHLQPIHQQVDVMLQNRGEVAGYEGFLVEEINPELVFGQLTIPRCFETEAELKRLSQKKDPISTAPMRRGCVKVSLKDQQESQSINQQKEKEDVKKLPASERQAGVTSVGVQQQPRTIIVGKGGTAEVKKIRLGVEHRDTSKLEKVKKRLSEALVEDKGGKGRRGRPKSSVGAGKDKEKASNPSPVGSSSLPTELKSKSEEADGKSCDDADDKRVQLGSVGKDKGKKPKRTEEVKKKMSQVSVEDKGGKGSPKGSVGAGKEDKNASDPSRVGSSDPSTALNSTSVEAGGKSCNDSDDKKVQLGSVGDDKRKKLKRTEEVKKLSEALVEDKGGKGSPKGSVGAGKEDKNASDPSHVGSSDPSSALKSTIEEAGGKSCNDSDDKTVQLGSVGEDKRKKRKRTEEVKKLSEALVEDKSGKGCPKSSVGDGKEFYFRYISGKKIKNASNPSLVGGSGPSLKSKNKTDGKSCDDTDAKKVLLGSVAEDKRKKRKRSEEDKVEEMNKKPFQTLDEDKDRKGRSKGSVGAGKDI